LRNSPLFDEFDTEIQEVKRTLLAATTDLASPLGDLVRAQVKRSTVPICAAVVLAVAKLQADSNLRHKRILLAAALEMLHVALNVHRLLVNAAVHEQQDSSEAYLDRSFIGSTILAGDYCFSRAAQMAAQTDHPRVVTTFSLALQTVSEGLLREQFHASGKMGDGKGRYDETRQLLQSGALAAALLVDLSESEQQEAIMLSQELASYWQIYQPESIIGELQPQVSQLRTLPTSWQLLYRWLHHQHMNDGSASSPQPQYC
jgi:octaprenyl-diphosphate synthase